jgi:hypothetical protein
MNSPTIFDQASITSVSCKRSRSPKRCISFGSTSAGACQRSARIFLSGKPRHSAITAARREGLTRSLPLARPPGLPVDVAASHLAPFIRLLFNHRRRAEQRRSMDTDGIQILRRSRQSILGFRQPLQRFNALTLQRFNARRSLNTSAACGWAEYSARRDTSLRCAARSGCRVRRESRPSRDRSTAHCHSRALRGQESLPSR